MSTRKSSQLDSYFSSDYSLSTMKLKIQQAKHSIRRVVVAFDSHQCRGLDKSRDWRLSRIGESAVR